MTNHNTINITAASDNIYIATQDGVREMCVEAINEQGEVVFQSGPIIGPPWDWNLRDAQGARVSPGTYLVIVTAQTAAGTLRKRVAPVTIAEEEKARTQAAVAPAPIAGEGTPGRIAKFATASTITDSIITELEGQIGIGTAASPAALTVISTAAGNPAITGQNNNNTGVIGRSNSGNGVFGRSFDANGVAGHSTSSAGVAGSSDSGVGVSGSSTAADGVAGGSTNGRGVSGRSNGNFGVYGESFFDVGVYGESRQLVGVKGVTHSDTEAGVVGTSLGAGNGIYGESILGYAGYFEGDVRVTGTLSGASGAFTIDHPLDPANKTLSHSFVESPDMMNIYNGNTVTDAYGEATVTLPAYFQALNHEFRYQLTVIEQFAQAMVSRKIRENQFTIKTDKPHVEVSWMVTGVRQDAYAKAHRIAVEDEKPATARGAYLHPEVYGQPKEKRVHQARRAGETRPMTTDAAPPQSAAHKG